MLLNSPIFPQPQLLLQVSVPVFSSAQVSLTVRTVAHSQPPPLASAPSPRQFPPPHQPRSLLSPPRTHPALSPNGCVSTTSATFPLVPPRPPPVSPSGMTPRRPRAKISSPLPTMPPPPSSPLTKTAMLLRPAYSPPTPSLPTQRPPPLPSTGDS